MFLDDKYRFGPFYLDIEQKLLYCDGKEVPVSMLKFDLLRVLLEWRNTVVSYEVLLSEVWHENYKTKAEIRTQAHKVSVHIDEVRNVLGKYRNCIESVRGRGYRFSDDILEHIEKESTDKSPIIQRPSMQEGHVVMTSQTGEAQRSVTGQSFGLNSPSVTISQEERRDDEQRSFGGFSLVVDGIVGNTAAELIHDDERTRDIRPQCASLYDYCLRDFAFAVVFSSTILTSQDFRPSFTQPVQPGTELFERLGDLWAPFQLDPRLTGNAILTHKNSEIKEDIQKLARGLTDPVIASLFKQFIIQEAKKHLGTDSSLFKEGLSPEQYKFDVKREYYRHADLQRSVGQKATDRLVSFIPEDPAKPYAHSALEQFVTQIALTLVTIMWEYDLAAEQRHMWRMPHILRALLKQKSRKHSLTQYQEELRELVVRSALLPALRDTEGSRRHLVVNRLLQLRDDRDFRSIREILEREGLSILQPDIANEKDARRILQYIKDQSDPAGLRDTFLLERRSALRKLNAASAPEFEAQLHRVFPELASFRELRNYTGLQAGDEADLRFKPPVGMVSDEGYKPTAQQDFRSTTLLGETSLLTIAEAEESVFSTEMLYEYLGGRVSAFRLYGAAEQCLAPQQIKVRYEDSNFLIPQALEVPGEERIRELTARRDRGEINFFDGPCARLLHWAEPSYESFAQDGRDHLELVLGPIGWYDVERTNGVLRNKLLKGERIDYEHWISLSALAQQGKVEASKLANLLDNAITIFTNDGQVGYQDRGAGQSVGAKQLSSSVAENLHRYFDDTKPGDPFGVLHLLPPEKKLSDGPDNKNCPPLQGELHPAAAVRRGITEETSYKMTDCIPEGGIKCTGLCFGLDALHPDLLWIVLVDLTAEQFIKKCRTERGRDWREGSIRFVPADFKDLETQSVLAQPNWVAGGKASLVRALELIDALCHRRHIPPTKVFDVIKRHASL